MMNIPSTVLLTGLKAAQFHIASSLEKIFILVYLTEVTFHPDLCESSQIPESLFYKQYNILLFFGLVQNRSLYSQTQ